MTDSEERRGVQGWSAQVWASLCNHGQVMAPLWAGGRAEGFCLEGAKGGRFRRGRRAGRLGCALRPGRHMSRQARFRVLVGGYHLSPKALRCYLLGPTCPGPQEESEGGLNGLRGPRCCLPGSGGPCSWLWGAQVEGVWPGEGWVRWTVRRGAWFGLFCQQGPQPG